ncbi:hypothetical protein SAMN04488490_1334 [Marinobacter sp. LV10R510-11A]|nr:hypothetical protein SAMN04488490_1334 [Marinobacter sp. LV10R510-11A]
MFFIVCEAVPRVVPWKVSKADGVRDTPQVIDQICDRTTVHIQPPFVMF